MCPSSSQAASKVGARWEGEDLAATVPRHMGHSTPALIYIYSHIGVAIASCFGSLFCRQGVEEEEGPAGARSQLIHDDETEEDEADDDGSSESDDDDVC